MINPSTIHDITILVSNNPSLADDIIQYGKYVYDSEEYQEWLNYDQFIPQPFLIPRHISSQNQRIKRLYDELNLIRNELLQVKINFHRGNLFFTDGLWVEGQYRTFPFTDESEHILNYIEGNDLHLWANMIIDPTTGCGHHVIGVNSNQQKFAFDINSRALAYTYLNALINRKDNIIVAFNDITKGIPPIVTEGTQNILLMGNLPFGLSPAKDILPLSSDGGETGAKSTMDGLRAVHDLHTRYPQKNIQAVVMFYSVGNASQDTWEIIEYARSIFPYANIEYHLLKEEKLWRINGKKEQDNPMPLSKLKLRADCRLYIDDLHREEMRSGYELLENKLRNQGWDHLGYGIMRVVIEPGG